MKNVQTRETTVPEETVPDRLVWELAAAYIASGQAKTLKQALPFVAKDLAAMVSGEFDELSIRVGGKSAPGAHGTPWNDFTDDIAILTSNQGEGFAIQVVRESGTEPRR